MEREMRQLDIVPEAQTSEPSTQRRSKRQAAGIHFNLYNNNDTDALNMVKCGSFAGVPGCGALTAQPFSIKVEPTALAVMDFHAHLVTLEVIGFLGGQWDPETRTIHVECAFPCRSVNAESDSQHVELDPLAEVWVREEVKRRNMRVVGWYHSHPIFAPQPSVRDVQNQVNYQWLFRDDAHNLQPFVGVIVAPFDKNTVTSNDASTMNWFYVQTQIEGRGSPMHCIHTVIKDSTLVPAKDITLVLRALVCFYKDHGRRVSMAAEWRRSKNNSSTSTKLEKLERSIRHRLVQVYGVEGAHDVLSVVIGCLNRNWKR